MTHFNEKRMEKLILQMNEKEVKAKSLMTSFTSIQELDASELNTVARELQSIAYSMREMEVEYHTLKRIKESEEVN